MDSTVATWLLCCVGCRRHTRRLAQLHAQFDMIQAIYPGTTYVCLFNTNGDIVAQRASSCDLAHPEEWPRIITALRRSVALFGGTLQVPDTQIVHIQGERHLFSSYSLPDRQHTLAFYTVMAHDAMAKWDCAQADLKLEPVCRELHRLLVPT